jgi:hypothetical protein
MPRKGSKHPYKPRREYRYSVKDIAELAGMTRNALNVAKVRGKIDPGDLKSVVSFLFRTIIERQLSRDLFIPASRGDKRMKKRTKKGKRGTQISGRKTKKAARRK